MGTALTEQQVDAIARLAPKALLCQDPDSAGQASAKRGLDALTALMKSDKWRTRAVEFKIVRLPTKQDPADVVQHAGADEMRRLLQTAMPIERFEVERALEIEGPSTDELLAEAVRIIAPLPVSVLRDELVKFTADRLGINVQIVDEVLRGTSAAAPRPQPWQSRQTAGTTAAGASSAASAAAGTDATASARRCRRPSPSTRARYSPAATGSEEAYLAYCIALPDEGERRLAEVDIDDYFSSLTTRKAAEYLRVHLRHPGCEPARAGTRSSPAWWPS